MKFISKYFALFIFLFSLHNAAYAIVITSLPFTCNQSNTTYTLATNLSIGSGNGITVIADNVIIDGNNNTLTYASTGAAKAISINANVTSLEIRNITFNQGNRNPASGERPFAIYRTGNASGLNIHDNTFNILYGGSYSNSAAFAISLVNARSRSVNNRIYANTFNLAGDSGGRAINIETRSTWEGSINNNSISMRDFYQGPSSYARAIMISGNGNGNAYIHNNYLNLDASVDTIQGISFWSASNFEVFDNTIDTAANKARTILIDGNSDGNKIYRNTITMTSQYPNASASAGIRVRYGSDNNIVYLNNIDASLGNSSYPLRLGGDDGLGQPVGTIIHNNMLVSKTRVISIEEGSDIIFYNNTLTPVNNSNAIYFYCTGAARCNNLSFNNDQINGTVRFTGISGQTGTTNLEFCSSVTADKLVSTSGNHQYTITESNCRYPNVPAPMPPGNVTITQN